jgi:anion-transporting  ArsA/GET3 family ATPase
MSVGFALVSTVMTKVVGGQLIKDLQTFIAACEALFGGFRTRAQETYRLLSSRHTTFLVVATPQRDALREAAYFVDRLTEEQMPLAGLVINRTHVSGLDVSAERALSLAEDLPEAAEVEVEALRRHADLMRVVESEQQLLHRFSAARPQVRRTLVETLPTDVTDVQTLRTVGDLLAKQD